MFQRKLSIRLLYIINFQEFFRLFQLELTGKATPQFVERKWSLPVTAFYTIVVVYQLSGSSSITWKRDDRKTTLHFVESAWSVSARASYTIALYHQLSGICSINWNADDRKSDTAICQKGKKRLGNIFMYDCCLSSIVMTFIDYLKCRWLENRHLNMSKRREVF